MASFSVVVCVVFYCMILGTHCVTQELGFPLKKSGLFNWSGSVLAAIQQNDGSILLRTLMGHGGNGQEDQYVQKEQIIAGPGNYSVYHTPEQEENAELNHIRKSRSDNEMLRTRHKNKKTRPNNKVLKNKLERKRSRRNLNGFGNVGGATANSFSVGLGGGGGFNPLMFLLPGLGFGGGGSFSGASASAGNLGGGLGFGRK